jgi:hypothetical protein
MWRKKILGRATFLGFAGSAAAARGAPRRLATIARRRYQTRASGEKRRK